MRNVVFQLVLKECVLPDYFVFSKLRELLNGRSEFADFDIEQAKDAIEIVRFTNYKDTNRFLLTFSVDFSIADSLSLDYTQKLILAFGELFRNEVDTVQGVFRFQDSFMLEEIFEFHREIYEIEMQIREVLNYVLAYNFAGNDLFDCIGEFESIAFGNEKMKREPEFRKKVFNEFLENEVFHIIFTRYGQFKYPKELKADKIFDLIKRSTSFDDLRELMQERGITETINASHKTFVNDLAANLQQIEDVRNEVMHNREIKESSNINQLAQKSGYAAAKKRFDELIKNFWEQEKNHLVENFQQAEFILKILTATLSIDEDESSTFTDLDFEEQEADDLEDLKCQFLDIVNSRLKISDQESLENLVSEQLNQIQLAGKTEALKKSNDI